MYVYREILSFSFSTMHQYICGDSKIILIFLLVHASQGSGSWSLPSKENAKDIFSRFLREFNVTNKCFFPCYSIHEPISK